MLGKDIHPTQRDLERAQDEFRHLVASNSAESAFQQLFAKAPFILARSIPLRVEPHEIHSLGWPGKSEPDFIFYPANPLPVSTYGVIELKRPSTKLVTRTRSNIIILSRDAQTAVSQGQLYAKELGREILHRAPATVILGSRSFVFVIAGLSHELLQIPETLDALVPTGVQLVPYDTLLSQFSSSVPPRVIFLVPREYSSTVCIDGLAKQIQQPAERFQINDENMAFWSLIEDNWRDGKYIGTRMPGQRIIHRPYWCIDRTDILATESPAHIDFPAYVNQLRKKIGESAAFHRRAVELEHLKPDMRGLLAAMSKEELVQMREAVSYCRRTKMPNYPFATHSANSEFLEHLGLIAFDFVDSGEVYHTVNPEVFAVLR